MGIVKRGVWLGTLLSLLVLWGFVFAADPIADLLRFRLNRASSIEIDQALTGLAKLQDPSRRLSILAHWFLGIPYKRDALGEGKGFDPDPIYDLSHVDCQTLVEQALGFVFAQSFKQARKITVQIRYANSIPEYSNRRHLVLAQWIPYVLQARLLDFVNRQWVGSSNVRTATKQIKRKTSCKGRWQTFCKRLGSHLPEGRFQFEYVPLTTAIEHCKSVPRGSVVFFLHTPRRYLPYQVFHAGIVVHFSKTPMLIHASKKKKKVVKTDFCRYLASLPLRYKKWPVLGITVLAPVPNPSDYGPDAK